MTTFSYDDYAYLRYALEVLRDAYTDENYSTVPIELLGDICKADEELMYIRDLDRELKRRMGIMEKRLANGSKGQKSKG